MIERHQESKFARTQITRRRMMLNNLKAIGVVAATAVVANLAKLRPAAAHHEDGERGFGGWRYPDLGGDRDRDVLCFMRGTKISTILGERSVEDLAIGDLLPTAFGGTRPIQWIVRYRRKKSDPSKPWKKYQQPVRIMSSALAPNIPHADLYVSAGHALYIDGLLVPAGSLINGTTIALYAADECDELEFFQVKLDTHDVIYAEGAPCETLLGVNETVNNFAEYVQKYGVPTPQDVHCAPIVCNGARSEIKSRVRSMMSPWLGPQRIDLIRDRLEERAMTFLPADRLIPSPHRSELAM